MPSFSVRRNISEAENKLRVLFCLNALGMATQEELWPFIAKLDFMDYLPMCMYVDELIGDGAVALGSHALQGVLYLTAEGEKQLSLFSAKLIPADRDRILDAAPRYLGELRARKQVRSAYERPTDAAFGAALTMREGDVPTLFIRLVTDDERLAGKAVRGFHSCAPLLLDLLYTLDLTSSASAAPAPLTQDEAIRTVRPGRPELCAFGGREHAAVVQFEDSTARYTVLLLLPTAQLAWDWAQAADTAGRELAGALNVLFYDAAEDTNP